MAFPELLLNAILLPEATCISRSWIAKDEACYIKDCNLVAVLQLATFVSANNLPIDKRPVARQIFQNCNEITPLLLVEYYAMAIGYRWDVKSEVWRSVSAENTRALCDHTHRTPGVARQDTLLESHQGVALSSPALTCDMTKGCRNTGLASLKPMNPQIYRPVRRDTPIRLPPPHLRHQAQTLQEDIARAPAYHREETKRRG